MIHGTNGVIVVDLIVVDLRRAWIFRARMRDSDPIGWKLRIQHE